MCKFPTRCGILQRNNSPLQTPLSRLRGVGAQKSLLLKNELGLTTYEDLLYYHPRKYIDRSELKRIADCRDGDSVTLLGKVLSSQMSFHGKKKLTVEISDGTASMSLLFFHSIKFFSEKLSRGTELLLYGKISFFRQRPQIVHPELDIIDPLSGKTSSANTARIIPMYSSSGVLSKKGFDSRGFRNLLSQIILEMQPQIDDFISQSELHSLGLMGLEEALYHIHFPNSMEEAEEARKRLAFNEVFFFNAMLISMQGKYLPSRETPSSLKSAEQSQFIEKLPFELTEDQKEAIKKINKLIKSHIPMNVLLQGDVGSGKTIVALSTAIPVMEEGFQVALMAPTEVLARQHYNTVKTFFGDKIKVELLAGKIPQKMRKTIEESISQGDTDIVIGTHALFQEKTEFHNLDYIIIDEQHKFGVQQRARLRQKGQDTNLLVMSATPIPRSLCLTQYGDLESINIKTRPKNRLPITTLAFPIERLRGIYNSIRKYVSRGRQVYYVLPLIEDSAEIDLQSAQSRFEDMEKFFSSEKVAMIHGKMPSNEKEPVMEAFVGGEIDILVSTTVIEVGIDVPNANVIVIEHAERFGLAQLHQLRGRVGRGPHESFCILLHTNKISGKSKTRINTMTETDDGFKIAEMDLELRGAGQLAGTKQHGFHGFEFTDIISDTNIIEEARNYALEKSKEFQNPEDLYAMVKSLPGSKKMQSLLS